MNSLVFFFFFFFFKYVHKLLSSSSFFTQMSYLLPQWKLAACDHGRLPISSLKGEERGSRKQNTQREKLVFSTPIPLDGYKKDKNTQENNLGTKKIRPTSQPLSLQATLCNAFDHIINTFLDPPVRPSIDPNHILTGNFSPVDELPPTECLAVEGELPPCLDGAYLRNGPNPRYFPRGPYHLFDGDGMLHSLRISRGYATFCSRYVKTYKFAIEEAAGAPVFPNFFSGFHGYAGIARVVVALARVLTGQFNPAQGFGVANTSLAFFSGKIFALGEPDLPYIVKLSREGEIDTEGRWDSEGNLSLGMTAHPKIDQDTGEMFAFRYWPIPPYLTYFRFDADGSKHPDVPIFSIGQPVIFHDFAITKRYAVFMESQIVMDPMEMILRGGSVIRVDPTKVPRIGILPRYATTEAEIQWFDMPGFNMMHSVNAWEEEDGTLVLVAPNLVTVQHILDRMELLRSRLEKVRIHLKTGHVSRIPLSAENFEFGIINPAYTGKKNRYAYMGTVDPMPTVSGVVKLDLEAAASGEITSGIVGRREYGTGCYGGEAFFVARNPGDLEAAEDDGYLVSYVHDGKSGGGGESKFVVMDARSPELEIVATVKLPGRVPYGFHGLFVSEKQLSEQPHW